MWRDRELLGSCITPSSSKNSAKKQAVYGWYVIGGTGPYPDEKKRAPRRSGAYILDQANRLDLGSDI